MSQVLTVRLPGQMLARLDRRAASLGRVRAEHIRQVLAADLAQSEVKPKRFASLSLKGRYALGSGSDNTSVRKALARRAYEKDR